MTRLLVRKSLKAMSGIPPTLCKKRGIKRLSVLGKKRIFNKKEEKKRHTVSSEEN